MDTGRKIMTNHSRLGRSLFPALALALACALHAPAAAEDGEFYVNTYRSIGNISPKGVRSSAMGGAGRGLADGVQSLGVNPGALGAFRGTQFDVALGYDMLDDGYDSADQTTFKLGGAANLDKWSQTSGPNQAIGALLQTRNYSGAGPQSMKRDETAVLAGYGIHLMDDLLAGVSVAFFNGKWKSDEQEPDPATGIAAPNIDRKITGGDFRVGGIYRLREETTLGGTLGYMTGSLKEKAAYAAGAGAGSGSMDRFSIGVGVAHQYAENTLVTGDLWWEKTSSDIPGILDETNKAWGLSVGVEQRVIPELLALRGGLYYDSNAYSGGRPIQNVVGADSYSQGRFGITAGVGVKLYNFDIGYALDVNSGGDVKNVLDVSAEW